MISPYTRLTQNYKGLRFRLYNLHTLNDRRAIVLAESGRYLIWTGGPAMTQIYKFPKHAKPTDRAEYECCMGGTPDGTFQEAIENALEDILENELKLKQMKNA